VGAAKALGGSTYNCMNNALGVLVELAVPDSQNRPALALKDLIAPTIGARSRVMPTVEFHDQLGFTAGEIDGVRPDRKLARELWPIA